MAHYETSEIFNIDLGGKGRRVDNVFVERLWRGLKYEEIYLKAYVASYQAEIEAGC
jgi:putative transposase